MAVGQKKWQGQVMVKVPFQDMLQELKIKTGRQIPQDDKSRPAEVAKAGNRDSSRIEKMPGASNVGRPADVA